jgi:hypothetical protein
MAGWGFFGLGQARQGKAHETTTASTDTQISENPDAYWAKLEVV